MFFYKIDDNPHETHGNILFCKISIEYWHTLETYGIQGILKGNGGNRPVLEYLPEGYIIEEGLDVFTSGKDGIFSPGSPIGKTFANGEVKLFSEASQLSFVKIDTAKINKENF